MTRVSDMATITAAGIDPRDPDSIAARSYLVWHAARHHPHRLERVTGPRGGYLYHGNLTSIILDLWPEMSPSDRHDELDRFRKEVYSFLRATKNAVNEKRGTNGGDVTWWIAADWAQPVGPVVLKVSTSSSHKPTSTERKLTPKEAGEDREPLPVTTTKVVTTTTTTTEDTYMTAATTEAPEKLNAIQRQKIRHDELKECIEDTVRKADPQPITVTEIAGDLGLHETTTRTILNELIEDGTVFSRTETPDERAVRYGLAGVPSVKATLYSIKSPVPERTKREAVKGIVAEAAERTPKGKYVNDAMVLNAMRSDRWERAAQIIKRARISQGSSTMVLTRLLESGAIETKDKRVGTTTYRVYRKVAQAKPENPPVVSVPAAPVEPQTGNLRKWAVDAVEALLIDVAKTSADPEEVARLKSELAKAEARIAELEKALAPLQALLGRGA